MQSNLKKYLDKEIGEHGYIEIRRYDNAFLCEGKLGELRTVPLWELINESESEYSKAYLGTSESGKRSIVVHLKKRWNDK